MKFWTVNNLDTALRKVPVNGFERVRPQREAFKFEDLMARRLNNFQCL